MKRIEPPEVLDAEEPIVPVEVERLDERRWHFLLPAAETREINDAMVRAAESWERGDEDATTAIIHELAARYPNNMQALTHVAGFFDALDVPDAAQFFWKRAFDVGRAGLSSDFFKQGNLLPSELSENRAFLKAFVHLEVEEIGLHARQLFIRLGGKARGSSVR